MRRSGLTTLFIGGCALVVGLGRLVQHYTIGEVVPDPPPVVVFWLSAAFGLAIVGLALRAFLDEYRGRHAAEDVRRLLTVALVATVLLIVAFIGGVASGRLA